MATNAELPYSFCKRFGVISAMSRASGKLKLTLKTSAPAEAIAEAQRLLGMVDEIEVESDIEFNRLLGQHFEGNRETSFNEAEKIGGELNLDDVSRYLSVPSAFLFIYYSSPIFLLFHSLLSFSLFFISSYIHF